MSKCVLYTCVHVPMETRRKCHIQWSWSHHGPLKRAAGRICCWAIALAPPLSFCAIHACHFWKATHNEGLPLMDYTRTLAWVYSRPCQSRIQKSSHRSLSWLIRKGTFHTLPVVVVDTRFTSGLTWSQITASVVPWAHWLVQVLVWSPPLKWCGWQTW